MEHFVSGILTGVFILHKQATSMTTTNQLHTLTLERDIFINEYEINSPTQIAKNHLLEVDRLHFQFFYSD